MKTYLLIFIAVLIGIVVFMSISETKDAGTFGANHHAVKMMSQIEEGN